MFSEKLHCAVRSPLKWTEPMHYKRHLTRTLLQDVPTPIQNGDQMSNVKLSNFA